MSVSAAAVILATTPANPAIISDAALLAIGFGLCHFGRFDSFRLWGLILKCYCSTCHSSPFQASTTTNSNTSAASNDAAAADPADEYSLKILVPGRTIGAVIGKGGASIKEITESTNAKVIVRPRDDVGSTRSERVVDIEGTVDSIAAAYESIMFKVEAEAK